MKQIPAIATKPCTIEDPTKYMVMGNRIALGSGRLTSLVVNNKDPDLESITQTAYREAAVADKGIAAKSNYSRMSSISPTFVPTSKKDGLVKIPRVDVQKDLSMTDIRARQPAIVTSNQNIQTTEEHESHEKTFDKQINAGTNEIGMLRFGEGATSPAYIALGQSGASLSTPTHQGGSAQVTPKNALGFKQLYDGHGNKVIISLINEPDNKIFLVKGAHLKEKRNSQMPPEVVTQSA